MVYALKQHTNKFKMIGSFSNTCACLILMGGVVNIIETFPSGPPNGVCERQHPSHTGSEPQAEPMPYTITINANEFSAGSALSVTIDAAPGTTFKGFLVTARNTFDENEFVGSFINIDSANQQHLCNAGVSHTNPTEKTSVALTWQAPSTIFQGNLIFRVTIVKSFAVYWAYESSEDIFNTDLPDNFTPPPTTTKGPVGELTPLSYCGDTIGCFRWPDDCNIGDCDMFVSWRPALDTETTVKFEMQVKRSSGWVALGFSEDDYMGNDYVLMCRGDSVSGDITSSFNDGHSNGLLSTRNFGLSNARVTVLDGTISCTVDREIAEADKSNFLNISNEFTLFLGNGPLTGGVQRQHEDLPIISSAKIAVAREAMGGADKAEPPSQSLAPTHRILPIYLLGFIGTCTSILYGIMYG